MDNASNVKGKQASVGSENPDLENEDPTITGSPPIREGGEDVTEQDIHDPAYLSLLRSLVTQSTSNISWRTPRRSKAEIQRELLGLKRKAFTLRQEGKIDEAEEVLIAAKALETQIAGKEVVITSPRMKLSDLLPVQQRKEM
ncbi:hypothetical protein OIU76_029081 [Salix suchowensis]|nr:hypothetical protein OIU76_029081 [Salix suchowensis]